MSRSEHPEQSKSVRLTKVQRELLDEFKGGPHPDRHVNPRYRRSAEALVRAGLLAPCIGQGWYSITAKGRSF